MPTFEESVIIARPPQDVFDFVTQPSNLPIWDSDILEAELIGDDPIGLGSRARGTTKVLGKRFDWTVEVTEFEPPTRVSNKAIEGPLQFAVSHVLEAVDGGTRLTYRIEAETGLGGVFGKLAEPLVVKARTRTVRANLESLADLLAEHPDA